MRKLQAWGEPLGFPFTSQRNYAKDQEHCSDSDERLISV